jgi:hypothetical protein
MWADMLKLQHTGIQARNPEIHIKRQRIPGRVIPKI